MPEPVMVPLAVPLGGALRPPCSRLLLLEDKVEHEHKLLFTVQLRQGWAEGGGMSLLLAMPPLDTDPLARLMDAGADLTLASSLDVLAEWAVLADGVEAVDFAELDLHVMMRCCCTGER